MARVVPWAGLGAIHNHPRAAKPKNSPWHHLLCLCRGIMPWSLHIRPREGIGPPWTPRNCPEGLVGLPDIPCFIVAKFVYPARGAQLPAEDVVRGGGGLDRGLFASASRGLLAAQLGPATRF